MKRIYLDLLYYFSSWLVWTFVIQYSLLAPHPGTLRKQMCYLQDVSSHHSFFFLALSRIERVLLATRAKEERSGKKLQRKRKTKGGRPLERNSPEQMQTAISNVGVGLMFFFVFFFFTRFKT